MCNPAAVVQVVGAAISIGSELMSADSEQKAAVANEEEAIRARKEDLITLGVRKEQEAQAAASTVLMQDHQARQLDAMARVAAGEAGVAGASIDALLDIQERDRLTAVVNTKRNLKATQEQLDREGQGIDAQSRNRIAQIQKPNWAGVSLRIGGKLLDSYAGYQSGTPGGKKGG